MAKKGLNLGKSPGISSGVFLLLMAGGIGLLVLGTGARTIGLYFLGLVVLYALLRNYDTILGQINGLGG